MNNVNSRLFYYIYKEFTMNCEKLQKGMVVHNYREMCKLLGEEVKTGNAKMYQLKEWSRYFQFEKNKHQFTITEIYDTPISKSDGRAGRFIARRNGETLNLIEPLLMELLNSPENRGEVIMSKSEIYSYLGMVNLEYAKHNTVFERPEFTYFKDKKISKEHLHYFYEVSNEVISNSLRSALTSLVKRGIIEYDNWYEISYNDGSKLIADREEADRIIEIQQETLDDMGLTKMGQALMFGNRQVYFHKRNTVAKRTRDWKKIFNVLRINLLVDDDSSRVRTIASCNKSFKELRSELNEVIITRILFDIDKSKEYFTWMGKVNVMSESDFFEDNQFTVQDSTVQDLTVQDSSCCTRLGSVYKNRLKKEVFRKALSDEAFLETQAFLIDTLIKI